MWRLVAILCNLIKTAHHRLYIEEIDARGVCWLLFDLDLDKEVIKVNFY